MFISTKVFLAVSVLTTALATPLRQRAYIDELKASMAHFAESWITIENTINALPKEGATVEKYKTATSAMDALTRYENNDYNVIIRENGPFTNIKWSNAFVEDMKVYLPHAVNAMHALQGHISQIAAVGGCSLVVDFRTSISNLLSAFGDMSGLLYRYIFQFVGTDALDSANNEFPMIPEISAALDAFTKKYWEIIYHGGNCPYN